MFLKLSNQYEYYLAATQQLVLVLTTMKVTKSGILATLISSIYEYLLSTTFSGYHCKVITVNCINHNASSYVIIEMLDLISNLLNMLWIFLNPNNASKQLFIISEPSYSIISTNIVTLLSIYQL